MRQAPGTAETLTNKDAEIILDIDHIESISPQTSSRYQIIYQDNNLNSSVMGVEKSYFGVKEINMDQGSFITDNNAKSSAKVVVLGATVSEDIFGESANPVGQKIKINKLNFKIIGVMEETGGGFNSSDDAVLVPLSTAQKYFTGSKNLSSIVVKVDDAQNMDNVQDKVNAALLQSHGIKSENDADFIIQNMEDMLEMASSVSSTLAILLGSIAGISLLVGGIGIMNMMLTTVTERTREIGLRKAIGAKAADINLQFLSESVTLTFLGGVLGVIFGWGASFLLTKFLDTATAVTWPAVVLACGVSIAIGIVFGYYPARRAAKLNPIEALRYE